MQKWIASTLGQLRLIGILEGISYLILLFLAMPLKYMYGQPQAVRVVGFVHGLLFVLFIKWLYDAKTEYGWSWQKVLMLLGLSMLPFGNFYADKKYLTGRG